MFCIQVAIAIYTRSRGAVGLVGCTGYRVVPFLVTGINLILVLRYYPRGPLGSPSLAPIRGAVVAEGITFTWPV
eukprot:SAG22_NODE_3009_length_2032_cov_1.605794_2_plen_74_part_00